MLDRMPSLSLGVPEHVPGGHGPPLPLLWRGVVPEHPIFHPRVGAPHLKDEMALKGRGPIYPQEL